MKKENLESEEQDSGNRLAKFIGGIVLASAAILPISGCVESYSSYGTYYPRVYERHVIINPPIFRQPRMYYPPQIHRDFRPQISPPDRTPQHFNNSPYRNYPNHQRDHRR